MGIPERKEREKEHRREEILNAAQRVFFEKGLQTATMDEIAEAAELSKGTLYLYYKSKEDLYLGVMIRGMDILYNMFTEATSTNEPTIVKIKNLGDMYYRYFKEHRSFFRMFYFFQNPLFHTQVSQEMMGLCQAGNQKVWKLVIDLIQRGIDEGDIRPEVDPAECAVILWSNSNGIMMRMDTQEEYFKNVLGVDLERVLQKSMAMLFQSMLRDPA
ncbi:MAG: TetR/AcrR family transcriptional regulator, partial [Cyclobacteriaceae bacterium]